MTELNSFQSFIAETLEDQFEAYDGDKAACLGDAMRGTATGWWSEFIYTHDVLTHFVNYRRGIAGALRSYAAEIGESPFGHPHHEFDETDATEAVAASLADIKEDDTLTRAASWMTSFAVEWETHNYATRHGIVV